MTILYRKSPKSEWISNLTFGIHSSDHKITVTSQLA